MSEYNAIEKNSLNGHPFPVSVEFSAKGDLFCVHSTPISVLEVIDLLPSRTYLLFNIDTNEYDELATVPLSRVANDCSSFIRKIDDEVLLMSQEQIIKLLNHVSHYNFNLIDVDESISDELVLRILELTDKVGDSTVIDKSDSEVYLNSHDDCYLYIETKDRTLAEQLILLQIKTLVTTIGNKTIAEVTFDPQEILLNDPLSLVIPQIPKEEPGKVTWNILEGTFKDFVYEKAMRDSGLRLVLAGTDLNIENVPSE